MLKRILTAAVLAPLFLLAMFKLPANGVLILIGVIMVGVAWEGMLLTGFRSQVVGFVYLLALVIAGVTAFAFVPPTLQSGSWVMIVCGIAGLWWLAHIYFLSRYAVDSPGVYGRVGGRAANVAFVLLTTWISVVALMTQDTHSPLLLVYVLVMIWIADSGAYFAGKFLGSHKLAVRVSPGKTIEGVVGGLLAVGIYASLYGHYVFRMERQQLLAWILLAVMVGAISVAGDLNESALKRTAGKKDSGSIIPGHGGLFDRVDAITAAVPVFYFGWSLLAMGATS